MDMAKEIRVKTPVGILVARDQGNPDFPGIMIDLERTQGGDSRALANIEWGENTEGVRGIFAALFRDFSSNDYSDYLYYKDPGNAVYGGSWYIGYPGGCEFVDGVDARDKRVSELVESGHKEEDIHVFPASSEIK